MMDDAPYRKKILDSEFPIATIIKKCFPEYLNGDTFKHIGTVTDYYVLDNPMDSSLSKYDLFPDALKFSRYYDSNGKVHDIDAINKIKKSTRDVHEKRKLHSLEHLKFLALKYTTF
jgi:hypothetical protein